MSNHSIAIIGTGIAAAWLAKRLSSHGCQVSIFEKARGIGGRTSSRRLKLGVEDFYIDLGAQFIETREPSFRNFIESMCASGICTHWNNYKLINIDASNKSTVGDIFPKGTELYVPVPQMNSLAKYLLKDFEISFQSKVTGINKTPEAKVKIEVENEIASSDFDLVVSTAPPEQSAELLKDFKLSQRIKEVEMKAHFAVALVAEDEYDFGFDGANIKNSMLNWIGINSSKPQRNSQLTVLMHTSYPWTIDNIDISVEELERQSLAELKRITACNTIEPRLITSHKWLMGRTKEALGEDFLLDLDEKVAICGDWMLGDDIESAWLSADRLADTLLANI